MSNKKVKDIEESARNVKDLDKAGERVKEIENMNNWNFLIVN